MNPIEIRKELCLLADDDDRYIDRTYAEDQPPYLPLPALVDKAHGAFITMWQPDVNELALLKNGAPVTITLLYTPYTDPKVPICPMRVEVGGADLR